MDHNDDGLGGRGRQTSAMSPWSVGRARSGSDWSLLERPKGFRHLPRRWVVERTIAWIGRYRRMSKDYEFLPASNEAMVYLTMIRVLLGRLAKPQA
jgi:transposase